MPYTNTGRSNVAPFAGGGQANFPADVIFIDSAPPPTGADVLAGTIAIVQSSGETYLCTKVAGATATWVLLTSGTTGSFTSLTATGGNITATNGNLILSTAGNGII